MQISPKNDLCNLLLKGLTARSFRLQSHTSEDPLETGVRLVDNRKSSIIYLKLTIVANNSSQTFWVSALICWSPLVANQLITITSWRIFILYSWSFFHRHRQLGVTWQTVAQTLLQFSLCSQDNECVYCPQQSFKCCLASVAQRMMTSSQQLLEFQLNFFVDYLSLVANHQIAAACRPLFSIMHSLGLAKVAKTIHKSFASNITVTGKIEARFAQQFAKCLWWSTTITILQEVDEHAHQPIHNQKDIGDPGKLQDDHLAKLG